MKRGKKPIKRVLISQKADPRPGTINPNPVEWKVTDPVMPDWLDKVGKKKWLELMNGLKPMAILSPVDSDLIANYCALYSQVVRCQHKINETEGFIETAGGSVKSHPAVDQFTALSSRMLAMGKCLGLSPLARVKLVADPQVQEKNWLSEICGVDDKEADE